MTEFRQQVLQCECFRTDQKDFGRIPGLVKNKPRQLYMTPCFREGGAGLIRPKQRVQARPAGHREGGGDGQQRRGIESCHLDILLLKVTPRTLRPDAPCAKDWPGPASTQDATILYYTSQADRQAGVRRCDRNTKLVGAGA